MTEKGLERLKEHEGYKQYPYQCTAGKLTIGIGFNLDDVGFSEEESLIILKIRTEKLTEKLDKYSWFKTLNVARKDIVINMAYNLGINGVIGFKGMIKAIISKDFELAAKEMLYKDGKNSRKGRSKYYVDVKGRAKELATLMIRGDY